MSGVSGFKSGPFWPRLLGKTFHARFSSRHAACWRRLMPEARSRSRRTRKRGVTLFEVSDRGRDHRARLRGRVGGRCQVLGQSSADTATTNARSIRQAVPLWWAQQDPGICPEIGQLMSDGILDDDTPAKDPWGMPWRIECNEQKVTVSSAARTKSWARRTTSGCPLRLPEDCGELLFRVNKSPDMTVVFEWSK